MSRLPLRFGLAIAAAFTLFVACDKVSVVTPPAASIQVSPADVTLTVGERSQLSVVIRDENGNQLGGQAVTWSSSEPDVASVSAGGEVFGMGIGSSTVTARAGSASATIRVTVRSAAGFALDRTTVAFTTRSGGSAGPETVLISGTGATPATGLTVSVTYPSGSASGWLDASLSSPTTPSSVILSADAQGLADGAYTAQVDVGSADAPTQSISVSLSVTGSPAIGLSRNSVQFDAQQGGAAPPVQSVAITNVGGGTLAGLGATVQYATNQVGGWLQATLQGTQAPTNLQLGVQQGALGPGTYNATVQLSAPGATNSPLSIAVTLVVSQNTQQPRIGVTDTVFTFVGVQGGADPADQTTSIQNIGGGTLTGLLTSVSYASGQPTGWLRATLSSTTAPATLTLATNVGSLAPGTYQASVELVSAVATNSPRFLRVFLTVNGAPTIGISPTSISFNGNQGGANPSAQTVSITNLGGGSVSGLSASVSYSSGSGWLATSLSSTTTPSTLTLNATTGALAQGTYSATVSLASTSAANSPVTIPVTFTVGPPAASIGVAPTSLSFTAVRGGSNPSSQAVNVTNTGGQPLTGLTSSVTGYTGGASGWLAATLSGSSAPATVTVQPTTGALGPGTYGATVQIVSAVADNSPRNVPVTLAIPGVSVSPSSRSISVSAGGTASATATLSNAGGGSLSGYATSVSYGSGSGWLTPSVSGNTLTLNVSAAGMSAGETHNATVTVTANEDLVGDQIAVTITVFSPPTILANPGSVTLDDTGPVSQPAGSSIAITNTGGGGANALTGLAASVSYAGGQPTGWLATSLNSTTSPATLSLTGDPASLGPGTYNATIQISSTASGVTNSPVSVPVTFTVGPKPAIGLSSTSVAFSSWQGGPDPAGSTVNVTNSGSGTLDGLTATISYSGGASGWLSAPLGGTTAPTSISLNASTAGLSQGTYTATVSVASTASRVQNSPQTVTVTFTVAAPPAIDLSPTSRSFTGFAGGTPPGSQTVNVTNSGGGTLSGLSVDSVTYASGSGWLGASLSGSTAPATLTLTADPGALGVGNYSAQVWIGSTAAGISNSPQAVSVSFDVQTPPTIVLGSTAEAHTVSEAPGSPATAMSTVSVGDAGTAVTGLGTSISYGTGSGWLAASLNQTTTPATLTLTSSAGSLAPGTYTATVSVTSGVAGNSPQDVGVTLTVDPAPSILLSKSGPLLFSALANTSPAAQTVDVTNSGGGGANALTGLATVITYLDSSSDASCTGTGTGWLTAGLSSTTSPSTITVQPGPLAGGGVVYCARVSVTSPVARNSAPFAGTSPDFIVRFTVN